MKEFKILRSVLCCILQVVQETVVLVTDKVADAALVIPWQPNSIGQSGSVGMFQSLFHINASYFNLMMNALIMNFFLRKQKLKSYFTVTSSSTFRVSPLLL